MASSRGAWRLLGRKPRSHALRACQASELLPQSNVRGASSHDRSKGVDPDGHIIRRSFLVHVLVLVLMDMSSSPLRMFDAGMRALAGAAVDVLTRDGLERLG